MTMYLLTFESIFEMSNGAKYGTVMHLFFVISSDAKNCIVLIYFGFNHCHVLGAKNDTVMYLLTLESIFIMFCDV